MATSPRRELVIKTVTTFEQGEDGWWTFMQRDLDGNEIMLGSGSELDEAVEVFFDAVEYDPTIVNENDTKAHYSELIHNEAVNTYDIREYAYGAPNPYPASA